MVVEPDNALVAVPAVFGANNAGVDVAQVAEFVGLAGVEFRCRVDQQGD